MVTDFTSPWLLRDTLSSAQFYTRQQLSSGLETASTKATTGTGKCRQKASKGKETPLLPKLQEPEAHECIWEPY